jgi:succinate-acetate transporter protein
MWEFASGNTFGAVAFSSYGAFWMSFACIFIPFFDVAGAYTSTTMLFNALGHYLICTTHLNLCSNPLAGWFMFTLFMTVATLRSSFALFGLFFTLTMAFMFLAIGYYKGADENFLKAGGWFGLITAMFAWYNAMAAIWNRDNSFIVLPVGQFPWAVKGRPHVGRKPKNR